MSDKVVTLRDGSQFEYDGIMRAWEVYAHLGYIEALAHDGKRLIIDRFFERTFKYLVCSTDDNGYIIDFNALLYVKVRSQEDMIAETIANRNKVMRIASACADEKSETPDNSQLSHGGDE